MNALTLPERAAVALGTAEHEIKLIALAKESTDIVAVTNTAGREQAHRIGMNLRTTRTTIQNIGKDARDDATKFSKAIIAEENRLISIIQPEETRVIGLRDGFDAEEKARKDALIAAERARVEGIQKLIGSLRDYPRIIQASDPAVLSVTLKAAIDEFDGWVPHIDDYAEFVPEAASAIAESLTIMRAMMDAAITKETEAARQQAEREAAAEELNRQRAAQEKVAQELAAAQAKLKADQAAQAEIARLAKAESDRAAAALKAAQDEFNAKIAAHEANLASEARAAQKLIDDAAHAELLLESQRLDKSSRELAAAQRLEAASVPVAISIVEPIAVPNTDAPTLTLGKIGSRLGFSLTADFLRSIGFEPAGRERAAVLYHEDQWQFICAALVDHIDNARVIQQQAA